MMLIPSYMQAVRDANRVEGWDAAHENCAWRGEI